MHFYNADHDLFISHVSIDAKNELSQTIEYLNEASQLARPELGNHIAKLINKINELISLLDSSESPWTKDQLTHILDNTINELNYAEELASGDSVPRLEAIKQSVINLNADIHKTSLKTKYDSISRDFSHTINNL